MVKRSRGGESVNLGDGGRREEGRRGGGERSLFLPTTKAVRGNNKHGEWCVSREALSRVSVRTGQREGRRKREKDRKGRGRKKEEDK